MMKSVRKATLAGVATVVVYLSVVVITTPALEPLDAISAAFRLNSIVIVGMGIGIDCKCFFQRKVRLWPVNLI